MPEESSRRAPRHKHRFETRVLLRLLEDLLAREAHDALHRVRLAGGRLAVGDERARAARDLSDGPLMRGASPRQLSLILSGNDQFDNDTIHPCVLGRVQK